MIPKRIHYCWFGNNKKSRVIKKCINSWNYHLGEYEIIEWNENNIDITHPFVKKAIKERQWAFLSDYIRLLVVYNHGGVYLDTDMYLLKSLDNLLNQKLFFGAERNEYISAGIFGAKENNGFIKSCLEYYENFNDEFVDFKLIPRVITNEFNKLKIDYSDFSFNLRHSDITIYEKSYFYTFPLENKLKLYKIKDYIDSNSYAVHLWEGSWLNSSEYFHLSRLNYDRAIHMFITNLYQNRNVGLGRKSYIINFLKSSVESFKNLIFFVKNFTN